MDTEKDMIKNTFMDSYECAAVNSGKDMLKGTVVDMHSHASLNTDQGVLKKTFLDSCKQTSMDTDTGIAMNTYIKSPLDSDKEALNDSYHTNNEIKDIKPKTTKNFEVKLCTEHEINTPLHCYEEHSLLKVTQIQQHKDATVKPETSAAHVSRTMICLGVLANFVLISPLVVIYWNTTWTLFDHFLLSHSCRLSAWASAAIGFPTMAAAIFLQDSMLSCSSKCNRLTAFVISRLYTYIVSVAVVCQWRSIWMVAHCYLGRTLMTSGLSLLAASLVLILMRCLVSVSAPPVSIALDVPRVDYYRIPTFWGSKRSVEPTLSTKRLLDILVTVVVVQVAVSTYWRSLWAILDLCLIPDNQLVSAVCSIGIGVGVSCALFLLHIPLRRLHAYLNSIHWLLHLICQDITSLLYSTVSVTIWRGIWTLINLYLPFRPNSLFVAHGVSFLVLTVCLASNSLLIRHIDRDGGRGLFFDARYVSTLVKTFLQKTGGSTDVNNNGNGVTLESGCHVGH